MYLRKIKFLQMMVTSLVLALLSICLIGCDTDGPIDLTVKDASGNIYPTTKIGGQIWMAKNLNTKTKGSWCYDNDSDNCEKYGRLYTWKAAKAACPDGWHLPSKEEFESLLDKVGSSGEERSAKLRVSFWADGKNKYGFSALPAGRRFSYANEYIHKLFVDLGGYAVFWSSTDDKYDAYFMAIGAGDTRVDVSPNPEWGDNDFGYSVRCLRNSTEEREALLARLSGAGASTVQNLETVTDPRDGQKYKTVKIGTQTWMAEDLNYSRMKLKKTAGGSPFWGLDFSDENVYLKQISHKACPAGWRLPNDDDWNGLTRVANVAGSANLALMKGKWGFEGECCEPETDDCIEGTETIVGKDTFGFGATGSMLSPYGGYRGEGECQSEQANYWSSSGKAYTIDRAEENPQLSSDPNYTVARIRCVQE